VHKGKLTMNKLLIISLLFFASNISFTQKVLSKEEILDELARIEKLYKRKDYVEKLEWSIDSVTKLFYDSLKNKNIDTIGIFVEYLPGYISNDTCDQDQSPKKCFIHWLKNDKYYSTVLTQFCDYKIKTIKSSTIIDYYRNSRDDLKNEKIPPCISSGEIDENGQFSIAAYFIDHEPNYTIFCKIANDSILIRFNESDFEYQESLFYKDNRSLKTYSWYKLIKNQIGIE